MKRLGLLQVKVYPRPRGGTCSSVMGVSPSPGLSPPMRGNLKAFAHRPVAQRSIPAHAGEPIILSPSFRLCMVYPRPRGGTAAAAGQQSSAEGLSPPTRGNPFSRPVSAYSARSIPAHAGEPRTPTRLLPSWSVYPRPRGGTAQASTQAPMKTGLSPPTRGNLELSYYIDPRDRSIPAHAGEPPYSSVRFDLPSVYPRPRGGTRVASSVVASGIGLSPPTRGNRRPIRPRPRRSGSIPAHAGEPHKQLADSLTRRVYPRPRGGTRCSGC